ncbi:MAG TPA: methylated-DNA--[protein]-cysteine S-methyltransferase, partial [Candidatus Deferrimicrobiaceae bacterium]|nr:methylated-DNA--[protein]-cysteine S-methyltransferase [Candidatus Deferrimicrobiaceae bacterium]
SEKAALNYVLNNLPFNTPFQLVPKPNLMATEILQAIKEIYCGKDTKIKLNLATDDLPVYTQKVLKATLAIPIGYVTSYGAIAAAVGGGARAVGNAMACNLFPPIVPCHRVVKADLSLGGYGAGGLGVKLEFLRREKRGFTEPKDVSINEASLRVFPVEDVLRKFA